MKLYQTVYRGLTSEAGSQAAHAVNALALPASLEQHRAAWRRLLAAVAGDEIRAVALAAMGGGDAALDNIAHIMRNA